MLQNKIYQNFLKDIFKTCLSVVFGLTLIALAVRAVNFLDLIVDNGYPVSIYFKYSFLNLFGIAPKFIPLAFLVSLMIFIIKHKNSNEFIILWTAGVKKIQIINLFLFSSLLIFIFYLLLSAFLTPMALNKSRQMLSKDEMNSFLPTIRTQQFSDSFKGFTFFVEKKFKNEVKNIFLHDTKNNLKNLSSNMTNISSTTIIAKEGLIEPRKMFLLDGQIISTKKDQGENEIIKFDQLSINLDQLSTTTIKEPKIQETSTLKLFSCYLPSSKKNKFCSNEVKKEITPALLRRIILPFYLPVIALLCSFLLFKNTNIFSNKFIVPFYSFLILVFTELSLRYTGINITLKYFFIAAPITSSLLLYFFLAYKFSNETKK